MKTMYYLASSLGSVDNIAQDLRKAGIKNWFIHILSNDESGIKKRRLHSSNYLETLDLIRDGLIGGVIGLAIGLLAVLLLIFIKPLGIELSGSIYFFVVMLLTFFGAWEGGLVGIASRNKKIRQFQEQINKGQHLVIIYTGKKYESRIQYIMGHKYPGVHLAAEDTHFLNPFSSPRPV